MVEFEVGAMEAGKKVHRLVRQLLPGVPLSGIHKMIRTGRVKRNGKKAKADDVLVVGDVVRLFMAESDYESVRKPTMKYGGVSRDVEVVYDDGQWLAVNKPAGLLTHGDRVEQKDTLANRVLAYLYDRGSLEDSPFRPAPVNRLDRNTSGLVLFGLHGEATRELADSIQQGRVRKWYVAIVKGQLPDGGEVKERLEREAGSNRTNVSRSGQEALTRYETIARGSTTCVARIELVTGRTHQIRAHFSHLGCPLWGDVKYGGGSAQKGSEGEARPGSETGVHQWLHAMWVELPNGTVVKAPLPEAFQRMLRRLGYTGEQLAGIQAEPRH